MATEAIADSLGLTDSQREEVLPSGKQRLLHSRIRWAKLYMTKAGLVVSPKRGIFTASAAGKSLVLTGPKVIDVDTLKAYPSFAKFYGKSATGGSPNESQATTIAATSTTTPAEQIDAAQLVRRDP